ncbi:MAG: DNA-binding protein WhiA [Clostridia bacterium]|nr:DNA-binding protein WhiA [Clostridia bacterium]
MSFADSVRTELVALIIKKPCCRRALIAGCLLGASRESGALSVMRCRSEEITSLVSDCIAKVYGKPPELTLSGSHGHVYRDLHIASPACAKLVSQLQSSDADAEALLHLHACEGCSSAFLRGVFLNYGTVNDPQKASHLEFSLPNGKGAELLAAYLEGMGYPSKRMARVNGTVGLYYKDSTSVGDMLTLMGAHGTVFTFYNARIAGDIRNNENRATNCVARNIEKSVSAAARQMEAIGKLMETGRLEVLPEPLRVTALLRYRNPDATLDELKDMHVPPISKSGLNHRLQKLLDAAELSERGSI